MYFLYALHTHTHTHLTCACILYVHIYICCTFAVANLCTITGMQTPLNSLTIIYGYLVCHASCRRSMIWTWTCEFRCVELDVRRVANPSSAVKEILLKVVVLRQNLGWTCTYCFKEVGLASGFLPPMLFRDSCLFHGASFLC